MDYKRYSKQAKSQIKGEAFFESIISNWAIPHKIVAPKDLGVDFICEWAFGDKPSGIIFSVQLKTVSEENIKIEPLGRDKGYCCLEQYRLSASVLDISDATLDYWNGLGIPSYLFVMVYTDSSIDCYYKRFTPVITEGIRHDTLPFYKVNNGTKFIAFHDEQKGTHGFARDLYIDHMRWNYHKGSISYLDPKIIGLNQFLAPTDRGVIFEDLFESYKRKICQTYFVTKEYLEKNCKIS